MKHILFICSSHGFEDGRVSQKEAVSLVKLGYKVSLCAQKSKWGYDEPVRMIDVDTGEVVPDWRSIGVLPRSTRWQRIGRLIRIYKICKREKPDLIVAHEFETAVLARVFHLFHGTPYVFDVHECFEDCVTKGIPKILHPLVMMIFYALSRSIVNASAGITAVSRASAILQYAQKKNKRNCILHNAPFLEFFPYKYEETTPVLLIHEGWLTANRGAFQMIEALAILARKHDFNLLLIGKVSEDIKEAFWSKVKECGLEDKIKDAGFLAWREIGKKESAGQIGLICSQSHPAHMKSLANKLYNYMACGLAVLGMKGSETEVILNDAKSGICVDTTKPEEIAKGLAWLIEHPQERRQMAENGRKAVETKYGWHCMEKEMESFYGAILKNA